MIRATRLMMLSAIVLVAAFVPSLGQASHGYVDADCIGTVANGSDGVCETTFPFEVTGFVSQFETHGNVHSLLAGGSIRLEWIDAAANTVFRSTCAAYGLSVNGTDTEQDGLGPFDAQSFTCSNEYLADHYVSGTQTLRVTATAVTCETESCTFHGHLELSPDNALF